MLEFTIWAVERLKQGEFLDEILKWGRGHANETCRAQIYRTITSIRGPLRLSTGCSRQNREGPILYPDGTAMDGEILKIEGHTVLIQVYGETRGLDMNSGIIFTDALKAAPLAPDVVGRIFNGSCVPIDGLPMFVPEKWAPVSGFPLNPTARARPEEFIETGLSVIDGLNTLVKGQKLPIFSCPGFRQGDGKGGAETCPAGEKLSGSMNAMRQGLSVLPRPRFTMNSPFDMKTLEEMKTGFVPRSTPASPGGTPLRRARPTAGNTSPRRKWMCGGHHGPPLRCPAEVSTAREELPGRRVSRHVFRPASIYERGRIIGMTGPLPCRRW
jgi:V/A-type H+-transporting ATPase subunit B